MAYNDQRPATIEGLAENLRRLGRSAKVATLERVDQVDQVAGREIRKVVRQAPSFLVGLVRDSVDEVADELEKSGKVDPKDLQGLSRSLARVTHDPRNAREAAEALDHLASAVRRSPDVRKLTSRVLQRLDDAGLLGADDLAQLVRWLGVAAMSGAVIDRIKEGGQIYLSVGPKIGTRKTPAVGLSINRLGEYKLKLAAPNPAWPRSALRLELKGSPSRPIKKASLTAPMTFKVSGSRRRSVTVSPYLRAEVEEDAWRRGSTDRLKEVEGGLRATLRFGGDAPGSPDLLAVQGAPDGGPIDLGLPDLMLGEGLLRRDLPGRRGLEIGVSPYAVPEVHDRSLVGVEEVGVKARVRFGHSPHAEVKRDKHEGAVAALFVLFGFVLASERGG